MSPGDLLVYADLARWEIQLRYRRGMGNYRADNGDEDILKKYKRGFFVEWRIADKHKAEHFESIGYLLDTNRSNEPKMISGRPSGQPWGRRRPVPSARCPISTRASGGDSG